MWEPLLDRADLAFSTRITHRGQADTASAIDQP
jgi:hypothetical protein